MMTLTNPFSEETSARSESSTPMPDMETVTPVPQRKRNKSSNPFLDEDAVVNPFFDYETQGRSKVKPQQSEKSSTSTIFDDSNPFKEAPDQSQTSIRVKPPPPVRTSSLIKPPEILVTLEENLASSCAPEEVSEPVGGADCVEFECPDTERLSPEGFSAELCSADQCEISSVSQQLDTSRESSANISLSTKQNQHLPDLDQVQDNGMDPRHSEFCDQFEDNKRTSIPMEDNQKLSGKVNTFFGSLKKRFKSLQRKSKTEDLSMFRNDVPRMTSTPVVKCPSERNNK